MRVLFLDNDVNMYEVFWDNIQAYWSDLYGDKLECDFVQNIKEARSKLDSPSGTYQILIADMLFPPLLNPKAETELHEPLGLEAIKMAKKKEKLLIVAISIGSPQQHPNLKDDALDAGAHIFKYRGELAKRPDQAFPAFCDEIHERLLREGILPDEVNLEHSQDPRIDYVIAEVGEKVIKSLYKQVLRGRLFPNTIRATYLTPGLSGAFVLKMEAAQENKPVVRHLFKLAKDKEILSKEIRNYPMTGVYSSSLIVKYVDLYESKIARVNDWHAIAAVFEEDAKSLRDWLYLPSNSGKVSEVLNSLFLEGGLTRGYETFDRSDPQSAIDALSPNPSRKARILDALAHFEEAIIHPRLGGDAEWKEKVAELKQFLKLKRIKDISPEEAIEHCYRCQNHGDLHSRNILVTTGGSPKALIIDTAEFNTYHWATDYVRLLVDLTVTVYDYGVPSYQWENIAHWSKLAYAIISRDTLSVDVGDMHRTNASSSISNVPALEAIQWLIDNISVICPAVAVKEDFIKRRWELDLALAVEFMRAAYRVDLTAPKRVFSLLSAYTALSRSEVSFLEAFPR